MQRITAVNPTEATGKAKELLDGVQTKLGMTPNLMNTLATGPAALEGTFPGCQEGRRPALRADARRFAAGGDLLRFQAHHLPEGGMGREAVFAGIGLGNREGNLFAKLRVQLAGAERGSKPQVCVQRGIVSDHEVAKVKAAGFNDGDIAELVANVALNVFTNYFNHVARTEVDFPQVPVAMETARA